MALGRMNFEIVKKSKGHSVVHAAAYRAREKLTETRTGKVFNYTNKAEELTAAFIMAPANTPAEYLERESMWNVVDRIDNRKNSQPAREVQMAIPHELNEAQREALVREYVQQEFVDRGMIADVAIHRPHKSADNDPRNHHAHILLTMRRVVDTADGGRAFSKNKEREWNDHENGTMWRLAWGHLINKHLEAAGLDVRVNPRTLIDTRLEGDEPGIHMGKAASALEKKGQRTRVGDHNRALRTKNHYRRAAGYKSKIARKGQNKSVQSVLPSGGGGGTSGGSKATQGASMTLTATEPKQPPPPIRPIFTKAASSGGGHGGGNRRKKQIPVQFDRRR